MADDTYQPLVYMMQGGDELVVTSTGLITVEDGGSVDIESGGGIDVQSGGDITIESGGELTIDSGGEIVWPVTGATSSAVGSTTLTEFTNSGVGFVTSSGDVRKFTIADPSPGCHRYLYFSAGSTAMVHYISVGSAGIIDTAGNTTNHMLAREGTTASAVAAYVHLVGWSTSKWMLMDSKPATSFVSVSTSS